MVRIWYPNDKVYFGDKRLSQSEANVYAYVADAAANIYQGNDVQYGSHSIIKNRLADIQLTLHVHVENPHFS